MKDIKTIIAEHGADLTEEQREAIISAVGENYRTIDEVEKKAARIKALEEQNAALTEQVGNLEGDGEELETLRKQVEKFQADEEARKATESEQAKRDAFRATFEQALGSKEFANDIVRDSVFEQVYQRCSDDTGTGAKEALEAITKDAYGIWKNPQNDPAKMPTADQFNKRTESTDNAMRSFADALFGGAR